MNPGLLRRLRIYFTGFGIGLLIVFIIFFRKSDRKLNIWMPEQRILEDIRSDSQFHADTRLLCLYDCLDIDSGIRGALWSGSTTKSLNPGGNPYHYLIRLKTEIRDLEAEVVRDSNGHTIQNIRDLQNPKNCQCP